MQGSRLYGSECQLISGLCSLLLCFCAANAGILPLTLQQRPAEAPLERLPLSLEKFGYIEYQPNGTLTFRGTLENGTNLESLILFKSMAQTVNVAPLPPAGDVAIHIEGIKMYGEGVEHKFPPFLERILQRIQGFFSVYRYTDTSQVLPAPPVVVQLAPPPGATTTTAKATTTRKPILTSVSNKLETSTAFGQSEREQDTAEDYAEFISIGEPGNDGYIQVGED